VGQRATPALAAVRAAGFKAVTSPYRNPRYEYVVTGTSPSGSAPAGSQVTLFVRNLTSGSGTSGSTAPAQKPAPATPATPSGSTAGKTPVPLPAQPVTPAQGTPATAAGGTSTGGASAPDDGATAGAGPGPVQYNIANLAQPSMTSATTTAPADTMAQNAANAQAAQSALDSFFGTGLSYAPQYERDYSAGQQPAANASGGQAPGDTQ